MFIGEEVLNWSLKDDSFRETKRDQSDISLLMDEHQKEYERMTSLQ